jgi:hypothetical protein
VNVGILTTGFNVCDIDHVVILFATMSNSKFIQVVGRGMRVAPNKKNCIISDHGTNGTRLGPLDNPIIKASGNGECPTKQCQAVINVINEVDIICNAHNLLTAKQCCECGAEFEIVGGNDKYTTLAETEPLLSHQQKQIEYYCAVASHHFAEHTSKSGNESLKLIFYTDNDELIGTHYFSIRADKSGWKQHNLSLLRGFFYDERDYWNNKNLFEDRTLHDVASTLNASYDMICKPIKGVKYKQEGRFKKITDLDLGELDN